MAGEPCTTGEREDLVEQLLRLAQALGADACTDRQAGEEILAALEAGGDYEPDDPASLAHGLIDGAERAERVAEVLCKAAKALGA